MLPPILVYVRCMDRFLQPIFQIRWDIDGHFVRLVRIGERERRNRACMGWVGVINKVINFSISFSAACPEILRCLRGKGRKYRREVGHEQ